MYDNTIITSEDRLLYEKLHKAIREEKREVFINKAKQKLLGILAISVSIASPLLLGDATISIIMLPLGLYTLFTKENTIY